LEYNNQMQQAAPEWLAEKFPYIKQLSPDHEKAIRRIPLLNIDSLLTPTPYILDRAIDVDYRHSFLWEEKGELLGYLLVYATPDQKKFHIYRAVTSPFGRGRGIGTALVCFLAHTVAPDSHIYLYVWDKLISSIEFFKSKGFSAEEPMVYRKMKFLLMSVTAGKLRETGAAAKPREASAVEELSKLRHDVKKSLKVLSDMASMLSVDNFSKIAEDMNRENRGLLNTLNMYEDKTHLSHKVNLKELITDRIIPYVEAVDSSCEVGLVFKSKIDPVSGSYGSYSRALINIVANALDAIKSAGRPGRLQFELEQRGDTVTLAVTDNGTGIETGKLVKGPDQVPLFVGKSTKGSLSGEGIGTRQIYSTFGADSIVVESRVDEFTRWTITMQVSKSRDAVVLTDLWSRYIRFIKSTQKINLTKESSRTEISAFIWQLRQMELFSFDLIYHFNRYNNVRDVYRSVLLYRAGHQPFDFLKDELKKCRIDSPPVRSWLLGITRRISRNETYLRENIRAEQHSGDLFQSYGQDHARTMIFTMDPETGNFFTTDRKLAEHVDFVSYLGKDRDELLRGELIGDVRNVNSPIQLGVWSVKDHDDLHRKLRMLRKGAQQLLQMGLREEKQIVFYTTTYNSCDREIDPGRTITLGEMASLEDADFEGLVREADNEMAGILFAT
jgi:ribosomal protein S18 acetylase RimI-like enzyme